ncbi:MAG: DNA repair protein RecO [Pseudomonadota bacterium]
MQWTDDALVLTSRGHGENHTITTLFTRERGAQSALVHGGQGSRKGAILQPGNRVQAAWQGRTDDDLGRFEVELELPYASGALATRLGVLGLGAMTELLIRVLPDGNAYPELFTATDAVLSHLHDEMIFPILMIRWEIGLLSALGFGLTLDRCAATDRMLEDGADLVFVSPKSGGAVSMEAGLPYQEKLLPLPAFVIDRGEPTWPEVAKAFTLTGFFLQNWLLAPDGGTLPEARERLVQKLKTRS